jgi:hypothetical protein
MSSSGVSYQTVKESERGMNINEWEYISWEKNYKAKEDLNTSEVSVDVDKEKWYTSLLKLRNNFDYWVTLSLKDLNLSDWKTSLIDVNDSPEVEVIITIEPAKEILKRDDRNRLFTIGFKQYELINPSPVLWVWELNNIQLDIDEIYSNGYNMIKLKWYNSFSLKGAWVKLSNDIESNEWYNLKFMYNKPLFYEVKKKKDVIIENLDGLNKDWKNFTDFSVWNNNIYQIQ